MSFPVFIDRISLSLFAALLVVAAVRDFREFRIPNVIVLAILAVYPIHILSSGALDGVLVALAMSAGLFAVGALLFAKGWMGGGDVKLLAGCTLWSGLENMSLFLAVTTLVGAGMAVLMLSRHRFLLARVCEGIGVPRGRDILIGRTLPYGVAIAAGGVAVAFALAAKTY